MHPTSTFDLILLDHADRVAAAARTRTRRARSAPADEPQPERPPDPSPLWAWSDDLLPAPLVGAVAR